MNTKLTLSIDRSVVVRAKEYLRENNQSLSRLVEDYFKTLINTKVKKSKGDTLVSMLTGVGKLPPQKSEKDVMVDYLLEKYE